MKKTLRKIIAIALITIISYCISAKTINAVEKSQNVQFFEIKKSEYENLKSTIKR